MTSNGRAKSTAPATTEYEMPELTIREREIIIATSAMRLLMTAVELVREDWRHEDYLIAQRLLDRLESKNAQIRSQKARQNAKASDRS